MRVGGRVLAATVRVAVLVATVVVVFFGCVATKKSTASIKYVAVVETEVDPASGASAELNSAEVRQLTAELRREAVKNLPNGKYNIMTQETVMSQGGAVLEECSDENCVIILGSKIGADYIVRGTISKFQTMFTLTVEMYETENGTMVASSDPVRSENIMGLLEKTAEVGGNMFRMFANPKSATKKQTAVAAQPSTPVNAPVSAQSGIIVSGTFTDDRDGKEYVTVVIGGKTWMGENLNYQPQSDNSWCYGDDESNCDKYGRLYDWNTAMTVCPDGWHLPSREEWQTLIYYAGDINAGKELKARNGWNKKGNGTDTYGFSALPSGRRRSDGYFYGVGNYGDWWTAMEGADGYAYYRYMYYSHSAVREYNRDKNYGFSVRCVK